MTTDQTTETGGEPLLIGPLLRRIAGTKATVWVETAHAAQVEVRAGDAGGRAATFSAFGHHYALVVVEGLTPGSSTPYDVYVDGEHAWPPADYPYPRSVIRTRADAEGATTARLVFGSCRETTQHATARRLPPDALDAYARRLMRDRDDPEAWPDMLVLLGDQVYADKTSATVRQQLKERTLPHHGVRDDVQTYDEYTKLYLESWRDPEIRWLFSTVPAVMMFDDHEIIDDWNSSAAWRADMRRQPWWAERVMNGLASYWVYQHMGNLSPDLLQDDALYPKVAAAGDATAILRDFASRVDQEADFGHDPESWKSRQYQWSFAVDLGRTRLVVLDNRCSRVLDPAHRAMLPAAEWSWFLSQAHGSSFDHLVVGSSLPWLMPPAIHHLEAWNERLSASRRPRVAAFGEMVRRAVDLEHWAAFGTSFEALADLFRVVGRSSTGPASISVLSGDVHHSYVARAELGRDVTTPVHQLTCSPIHNQVPSFMRPLMRVGWAGWAAVIAHGLARVSGARTPSLRWRKTGDGPYFGNAVATLVHRDLEARVLIEGTTPDGGLDVVADVVLTTR
ncbi:alkaline phosphatase D family protein [Catenuloplanes atrovinosus]|uniref:PhoD-like phosphatase metallophosphatase domain-containing protein n=1 Tax=Catenuloplanes atrovinosus TaxID=137266 RepID=A0AAE4C7C5_9ACTN|nr:alkaline phosphatase D family protein [Catenuloplanes atrovinosus]MDR7273312.1 hypothetical protein [Catenuloplanes atrovinosus]